MNPFGRYYRRRIPDEKMSRMTGQMIDLSYRKSDPIAVKRKS